MSFVKHNGNMIMGIPIIAVLSMHTICIASMTTGQGIGHAQTIMVTHVCIHARGNKSDCRSSAERSGGRGEGWVGSSWGQAHISDCGLPNTCLSVNTKFCSTISYREGQSIWVYTRRHEVVVTAAVRGRSLPDTGFWGSFCILHLLFKIYMQSVTRFLFWHLYRKTIKSPENQQILRRLVQDVKGLNPTFDAADIRGKCM